jgi:hypothetical protein
MSRYLIRMCWIITLMIGVQAVCAQNMAKWGKLIKDAGIRE